MLIPSPHDRFHTHRLRLMRFTAIAGAMCASLHASCAVAALAADDPEPVMIDPVELIVEDVSPIPMDVGEDEATAGMVEPLGPQSKLPKEEVEWLRHQYDALSKERQAEMKAYYKDLGLDLDIVLGLASSAASEAARIQECLGALRELDFARSPQNVLSARAKLGFGQVPYPNPTTARGGDIARWVHLQVMAGEWSSLSAYLLARPKDEGQRIYSQLLQQMNRGNPGLLPEEVLALTEACPEEPKAWQSAAWVSMLKFAVEKNSPGPMLAQIKAGTRFFGTRDAQTRRRTVELLSGSGLVAQAYEFLPSLNEARAAGDGELVLVHGLYRADLASRTVAGSGGGTGISGGIESVEAQSHRAAAWDLFCETSLMERASMKARREAIKQAVALMSRMPRARVVPWLREVFASDTLGPATLEAIALSAASVGEAKPGQPDDHRAQSIVSLKEAVDVLLERPNLDQSVLRVPMRMLTTALVSEMENALGRKGRQQNQAHEAQMLLRAAPNAAWFDALEPSLAVRAGKACIAIATKADETDIALSMLADAVKRTPDQAIPIADAFLKVWESRLNPPSEVDDDMRMYYFWREYVAQAPLTRGRQRRNLERLGRVMDTVRAFGVDPRQLPTMTAAFQACHGLTEVYDRADIERVFGAFDAIPATSAAALAQSMAASLNGDWRNRAVQVENGVKRTDAEVAQLVDKGYGVAIELIDHALTHQPDSWRFAVVKAGLSYDRLQFRKIQKKSSDSAKDAEYRAAAFAAFEQAAQRYAAAISGGEDRENAGVFERWFGAAMGTSQLNFLTADDMPTDVAAAAGSSGGADAKATPASEDQVDRIKRAIAALPPDAAFRHIGEFAQAIGAAVARADAEVKPKLVKHALRIIGDHPSGASLRGLDELYRDLVKDEIKLRLAIDGDDRVGTSRQFGVLLSLRFTNAVDRETGGFSQYLQTSAWVRVGRQYQEVNFREKLEKNIQSAFGTGFTVESIGFFDAFMPPRGVMEGGQDGWLEKPMAYIVLSRKDPTADRLPQVTLDMQFEDQTGPVTLVLPSNTPALAIADDTAAVARPCLDFKITQIVDPRDARDGERDRTIKLEVVCRGKGVIPDLSTLLSGVQSAIDGYRVSENGIETRPTIVVEEGDPKGSRWGWGSHKPPEGGYPEPDGSGMYRLGVERGWVITYAPVGPRYGRQFRLPALNPGVNATLESRYFSDLDIVPATSSHVPVERRGVLWTVLLIGVPVFLLIACGVLLYRRTRPRVAPAPLSVELPDHVTPLSTLVSLRRMAREHGSRLDSARRGELDREIAMIEMKYFGPGHAEHAVGELAEALTRWSSAVRS